MDQQQAIKNITIENAHIAFRNFSGKEGKFNPAGRRNFCVFLEPDVAKELADIGWNIRVLKPKDPEDDEQAYIQVTVNYRQMPPKIVMITSKNKSVLNEDSVGILDWAEITYVDLIIHPYLWEVNGKSGIKAYVKSMYVTLAEDDFEGKYIDVPDAANSSPEDGD